MHTKSFLPRSCRKSVLDKITSSRRNNLGVILPRLAEQIRFAGFLAPPINRLFLTIQLRIHERLTERENLLSLGLIDIGQDNVLTPKRYEALGCIDVICCIVKIITNTNRNDLSLESCQNPKCIR